MLKSEIVKAFAEASFDEINTLVEQALSEGHDPFDVLESCRIGMTKVGEEYSKGNYYLAELILSGEIFKEVSTKLEPLLVNKKNQIVTKGTVVIGTPQGDIHDIGKDIVATVFRASGFKVHNLGVDVAPDVFVENIISTNAEIVAMSALITPTFVTMKSIVDKLVQMNQREGRFVIIGGGPTTLTVRDYVGADAWTLDPQHGVELCKEFLISLKN